MHGKMESAMPWSPERVVIVVHITTPPAQGRGAVKSTSTDGTATARLRLGAHEHPPFPRFALDYFPVCALGFYQFGELRCNYANRGPTPLVAGLVFVLSSFFFFLGVCVCIGAIFSFQRYHSP